MTPRQGSVPPGNTVVQCDFDGTITTEDVSFMLLDAFGDPGWRRWLRRYEAGEITVGQFNSLVFATVRADRQTMLDYLQGRVVVRSGFPEFVETCRAKGFRLEIVSNGLDFYIRHILAGAGANDVDVHAAETRFLPDGLQVRYRRPNGRTADDAVKLGYVHYFQAEGNRVIYVGNGTSDLEAARQADVIFATGTLLRLCRDNNVACTPFCDFSQVAAGLRAL